MNTPHFILLHDSDSPWGDAKIIDQWHRQRGFNGIGYHRVLLNGRRTKGSDYNEAEDGLVEVGRKDEQEGAHCEGYNSCSLAICLIGPGIDSSRPYTEKQMAALRALVRDLMARHKIPLSNVYGHKDTLAGRRKGKRDPAFELQAFRASLGAP